MKFDEIAPHILKSINSYEKQWDIKTLKVECYAKGDNWAIFVAHKSDNTKTGFYARKGQRANDDAWHYFCPSKSETEIGLPTIAEIIQIIDKENESKRGKFG